MVFAKQLREKIRRGRIRCTVRIWQRLHVKVGGRYPMEDGHVVVDSIEPIGKKQITHDLARESGFDSVGDLMKIAKHGRGDRIYLIRFHYLPPGAWDGPRWKKACFIAAAFVLGAALSAAQQKPDFSGEWILNRPASRLSPAADAVQSGTVHIEHREPIFRYKATLVTDGKPFEYAYELPTDGSEVAGTQQRRPTSTSLRWDGDALVFAGRVEGANGETRISFRYELLDGGRRLRGVEQVRANGRNQDNVWVFERK